MYELKDRVQQLDFHEQLWFASICAHHAVLVFGNNYGFDFANPGQSIKEPGNALNDIVLSLQPNNNTIVETARHELAIMDVTPDVDVAGSEHTSAMYACTAIVSILKAIENRDSSQIIRSLYYCLDAVDSFSERNVRGRKEELEWHVEVLNRVESNSVLKPEVFDDLLDSSPQWLKDWEEWTL